MKRWNFSALKEWINREGCKKVLRWLREIYLIFGFISL
jgi:hypothetical protein